MTHKAAFVAAVVLVGSLGYATRPDDAHSTHPTQPLAASIARAGVTAGDGIEEHVTAPKLRDFDLLAPHVPVSFIPLPKPKPDNYYLWLRVAFCESSSNWHIVSPPFYGGLQFTLSTWTSFDVQHFAPRADLATRRQQMIVANHVLRVQGQGAWPLCGRGIL